MRLFISAIEPSANVHLRELARCLDSELQVRNGENGKTFEVVGIFDESCFENCKNINARSSYDLSEFSVMAFFDALRKYSFFKRVNDEMINLAKSCDTALLMDSSSFNIPLAKGVQKLNSEISESKTRVIYYILPQVWAWKKWRAKKIEKICDFLCATLPFELKMYPNAVRENRAQFVGHPLLDELGFENLDSENSDSVNLSAQGKCADSEKLNFENLNSENLPSKARNDRPNSEISEFKPLVFMPGSRKGEIKRIFPIFANAAKTLRQKYPQHAQILVLPQHFKDFSESKLLEIYGNELKNFAISFDATKELKNCKFAFICSGTATLQATLLRAPFVLCYKMRQIEFYIAKAFVKLNAIGLANILYQNLMQDNGAKLHAELIQDDFNEQKMISEFENFDYEKFFSESNNLKSYLKSGSSKNVAQLILKA